MGKITQNQGNWGYEKTVSIATFTGARRNVKNTNKWMDHMVLEWHQITGLIGTFGYIFSYFLVQFGYISAPGYWYCFLNILSAGLVGVSLFHEFNLPSALIQISWILISVGGIAKLLSRSAITDKDETQFSGSG